MLSVICFNLDKSKILLSGNGLRTLEEKDICEKEKMLLCFSFLDNCIIWATFDFLSAEVFILDVSEFSYVSLSIFVANVIQVHLFLKVCANCRFEIRGNRVMGEKVPASYVVSLVMPSYTKINLTIQTKIRLH